jgi:hypothetical protein
MPIYATHKCCVLHQDTLNTHWGDIQHKITTLPMLDFVQRNLLLVYFHEKYVEKIRALMTADSGRHFFH